MRLDRCVLFVGIVHEQRTVNIVRQLIGPALLQGAIATLKACFHIWSHERSSRQLAENALHPKRINLEEAQGSVGAHFPQRPYRSSRLRRRRRGMPEAVLLVLTDLVGLQKLRHPLPEFGHGEGAACSEVV